MQHTLEEAKAMLTEAIFNHRWVLLEGYHQAGEILLKELRSTKNKPYTALCEEFGRHLGQRAKTAHYCMELVKKYPDINSVPDGKVASWYKITKTLPPYENEGKTKKAK